VTQHRQEERVDLAVFGRILDSSKASVFGGACQAGRDDPYDS
jgi:hypothetical protein